MPVLDIRTYYHVVVAHTAAFEMPEDP